MAYQDGDFFFGRSDARAKLARHLTQSRHGFTGDNPRALKQPLMVDELSPGPALAHPSSRRLVIRKGLDGRKGDPISAEHPQYRDERTIWERSLQGVIRGHERYKDTFDLLNYFQNKDEEYLGFAHKCKAGLVMALQENRQVHYALDLINMDAVVDKSPGRRSGESITSRELRWIFRNWGNGKVRLLVHFYVNNSEVEAPWLSDPDKWARYVQTAYRDFKGKAHVPDKEAFFELVRRPNPHRRPRLVRNIGTRLDNYHAGTWRENAMGAVATQRRRQALEEIMGMCNQALVSRSVNRARRPGIRFLRGKIQDELTRIQNQRSPW